MKYCKKCVMPDTRPGIALNGEGVCSALRASPTREEKISTGMKDGKYLKVYAISTEK